MRYIKVFCTNEPPDIPIVSVHEIDHEQFETRKVELFSSGEVGYASKEKNTKTTMLSYVPLPSNKEINDQSSFNVEIISKEHFETIWNFVS